MSSPPANPISPYDSDEDFRRWRKKKGRGRHVLLVDDDKELTRMFMERVPRYNFSLYTATNGDEAIRQYQEHLPDTILLDIKLDGAMDGIDVFRRVREIERQMGLTEEESSVIFVSAYLGYTAEQAIYRMGEVALLFPKPPESEFTDSIMHKLLRHIRVFPRTPPPPPM